MTSLEIALICVLLLLIIIGGVIYYKYRQCINLKAYTLPSAVAVSSCTLPTPAAGASNVTPAAPTLTSAYMTRFWPSTPGSSYRSTFFDKSSSGSSGSTPALYLTIFKIADALAIVNAAGALCNYGASATIPSQLQANCALINSVYGTAAYTTTSGTTTMSITAATGAPATVGVFTSTEGGTTADPAMPLIVDLSGSGIMLSTAYSNLKPVTYSP